MAEMEGFNRHACQVLINKGFLRLPQCPFVALSWGTRQLRSDVESLGRRPGQVFTTSLELSNPAWIDEGDHIIMRL
ncbi:hypothetical protein [Microvirga sp. Mcv34]|uniref:hypothetical protein n=1 Tax=Microvirga sp. Mcv34 TaxID=2926016 RepID=UPI0021CA273E|nr:hypothetical protein [Microvirga sp. Mcv34]